MDFYFYCLNMRKRIIFLLPKQGMGMLLYLLKIKEKEYFKEAFFSFLRHIEDIDKVVELFWEKNIHKIKPWYQEQQEKTDVIISASPDFLLQPLKKKLGFFKVIATNVDKKTGLFLSKNCYGEEKVVRFQKELPNAKIDGFYSDSKSDTPMFRLAKKAFLVGKDTITEISI